MIEIKENHTKERYEIVISTDRKDVFRFLKMKVERLVDNFKLRYGIK